MQNRNSKSNKAPSLPPTPTNTLTVRDGPHPLNRYWRDWQTFIQPSSTKHYWWGRALVYFNNVRHPDYTNSPEILERSRKNYKFHTPCMYVSSDVQIWILCNIFTIVSIATQWSFSVPVEWLVCNLPLELLWKTAIKILATPHHGNNFSSLSVLETEEHYVSLQMLFTNALSSCLVWTRYVSELLVHCTSVCPWEQSISAVLHSWKWTEYELNGSLN